MRPQLPRAVPREKCAKRVIMNRSAAAADPIDHQLPLGMGPFINDVSTGRGWGVIPACENGTFSQGGQKYEQFARRHLLDDPPSFAGPSFPPSVLWLVVSVPLMTTMSVASLSARVFCSPSLFLCRKYILVLRRLSKSANRGFIHKNYSQKC